MWPVMPSEEESAVLECFRQEVASGLASPDDSEFEVVAMNDASKRRLIAPGAQEETYGASSQRQMPVLTMAMPSETTKSSPCDVGDSSSRR